MKRLTLLFTCFIMSMMLAIAQNKQVSGTVTDENGEPIVGASVIAKGNAALGTVTNVDGKFSLSVPASVTKLTVKYLGMHDQEIAASSNITVKMQPAESALDEVIVVAYGTAKKSQFTGSATVVKAEDIGKIQTSNVADALVGKVPGMQISNSSGQPGVTTPAIRVRGIGSINAGNDPLIVVDGAPYDGDLNNLNSMDIESVTTLKDAASNALYGARGANGVILITTKKGASGEARVTVDAKWGANTRSLPDYNYIKSPAQYYEMYYGALNKYFVNTMGYSPDNAYALANRYMTLSGNDYGVGYNVYNVPKGQYLIGTNGKLNPNATIGNVVSYNGQDYLLKPDNWLSNVYKQSIRKEYNVGISGGNDKSSFYTSVGYMDNQGIIPNSGYKRFSSRLKADYQAKSWLKVGGNMAYTNFNYNYLNINSDGDGASNSSGNVFAIATRIAPIYPLYIRDGKGNIMKDSNGITMYDYGDGGNAGLSRPYLGNSNALSALLLDTNGGEGNAISASGFADITFLKNFTFSTINSTSMYETRYTNVTNPYYGQYASSNGIVYKESDRNFSYDYQQLLKYVKDIDVNHINIMLGHDYYRSQFFMLNATKMNMFDPSNHELRGAVTDGSPDSYTTDYNTEGFFGRGMYDYDNKYYGSVSYRRDASSRFHPNHRWGNFWSAGVAWMISKEKWFETVSWIDQLKLKASYGEQGNDNIGSYLYDYTNYRYVDTYTIVNSGGSPAAIPNYKGNENITWEKQGNFNTGIEFSLFKERLSGDVEYYYRKTSAMLFPFPLPPSFGWTSYYANIGDMRNTGVEIDLKGAVVKTRDFEWDLNANITLQRNKIIFLPPERKTMTVSGVNGYSSLNYFFGEGIPLYTFYMKQYAGVDKDGQATYYKDDKDGKGNLTGTRSPVTNWSDASYYLCGSALPDAYGGFGTSLRFKGFDLSATFAYQLGGLVYDSDYAYAMSSPVATSKGNAFHADLLKAWTPDNPTSNIPRFQFGDQYANYVSNRFLTKASFLSFQNINLGYMLPSRICKHLGIENIRIYAVCDNVWLWSMRQGLDPRQNIEPNGIFNNSGTGGFNTASYYAPIRSLSGGLTITF